VAKEKSHILPNKPQPHKHGEKNFPCKEGPGVDTMASTILWFNQLNFSLIKYQNTNYSQESVSYFYSTCHSYRFPKILPFPTSHTLEKQDIAGSPMTEWKVGYGLALRSYRSQTHTDPHMK
jgi:hypothetical protein